MKKRLILGLKLTLAIGLIVWLVLANVTEVRISLGELDGGDRVGAAPEFTVEAVLIEASETLEEGQAVLRLRRGDESFELLSAQKGRISSLEVSEGDLVQSDTVAITLASALPFSDLGKLAETWPWFALAQIPFGIVLLLAALRWRILLSAQGIHYGFRETHSLILIGHFFNQVMLGSTGGDVVKAYYVAVESPDRRTAGVLTVFLDRAIGLLVLVLIACVAVLLNLNLVLDENNLGLLSLAIALWVGLIGCLVFAVCFFSDRVRTHPVVTAVLGRLPFQGILRKVASAVFVYKSHGRGMVRVLGISVAIHLLVVVTNLLLLRCLQPVLPSAISFFLLVPLAQIIMAIPLTPASLGTAETAYQKLFALVGVPAGALVSILQRLTYYFWSIFGCVAYLRRKSTVRRALEASARDEELSNDAASQSPQESSPADEPEAVERDDPVSDTPTSSQGGDFEVSAKPQL